MEGEERRRVETARSQSNTSFSGVMELRPGAGDDVEVISRFGSGFLFGGYTMAAAVRAAALSVPAGLVPKSLDASFLSFGQWTDLSAAVSRWQDTRTFSVRQVALRQQGERPIAAVRVSLHRPESGPDRQLQGAPLADDPEGLAAIDVAMSGTDLIELRPGRAGAGAGFSRLHPYWCRVRETLGPDASGADAAEHAAGLAFMSDYLVVATPFEPGTAEGESMVSRTLEHSIWFHRPFRADEWLLFDAEPLTMSAGRYVSRGSVHSRAGVLVASFVQEGFVRPRVP